MFIQVRNINGSLLLAVLRKSRNVFVAVMFILRYAKLVDVLMSLRNCDYESDDATVALFETALTLFVMFCQSCHSSACLYLLLST